MHIRGKSPQGVIERVGEVLIQNGEGFSLSDRNVIPSEYWCILVNEDGDIVWSENMPEDIPKHYTINDIARLTRWFLNDYPVYVRTTDYGLLILGIPKNSVGKYDMAYSMKWFDSLPQRLIFILILNIILAAVIAFFVGISLYKNLYSLMVGVNDLRQEKSVKLREKGIFKELSKNLNNTSRVIERKNAALALRDRARINWIAGISHDIRTPLSVIMGYSEELADMTELSEQNRQKAESIKQQSVKIKKLIEDLNLISSLEYDMQPSKKSSVRICPMLRQVVSDVMNGSISDKYEINVELMNEGVTVSADKNLLERAIFNLINNSISHNENGCKINILSYSKRDAVYIVISDNGTGVDSKIIENLSVMPKTTHGMGLPMAYKIVEAHGGKFIAENDNGFKVTIELPMEA